MSTGDVNLQFTAEQARFGEHIPAHVQEALGSLPVRSFVKSDYKHLDKWMVSLSAFYDGHTAESKLLDQLVGSEQADPNGFFTKKKALLVSYDESSGNPTGALCLNYKRGGAVKIGPVVVDGERRGQGIGKTLFAAADIFAGAVEARKLFATTSHLNTAVNRLFDSYGFAVEATFPDQYKRGSNELVWGKFTEGHPALADQTVKSLVQEPVGPVVKIDSYTEADRRFVTYVNNTYNGWHDDLGEDFIDGMVAGQGRGLSYQDKGKVILLGKTEDDKPVGMLTFTPKRGGPVKIYPVAGSADAQATLLDRATDIAREHGNHKLYTFAHESDRAQHRLLTEQDFVMRGMLRSPYKDGHDLNAFDKMIS